MRMLLDESVPSRLGAMLVVVARTNRMVVLAPLVPAVLQAIGEMPPRTLRTVGG